MKSVRFVRSSIEIVAFAVPLGLAFAGWFAVPSGFAL